MSIVLASVPIVTVCNNPALGTNPDCETLTLGVQSLGRIKRHNTEQKYDQGQNASRRLQRNERMFELVSL